MGEDISRGPLPVRSTRRPLLLPHILVPPAVASFANGNGGHYDGGNFGGVGYGAGGAAPGAAAGALSLAGAGGGGVGRFGGVGAKGSMPRGNDPGVFSNVARGAPPGFSNIDGVGTYSSPGAPPRDPYNGANTATTGFPHGTSAVAGVPVAAPAYPFASHAPFPGSSTPGEGSGGGGGGGGAGDGDGDGGDGTASWAGARAGVGAITTVQDPDPHVEAVLRAAKCERLLPLFVARRIDLPKLFNMDDDDFKMLTVRHLYFWAVE